MAFGRKMKQQQFDEAEDEDQREEMDEEEEEDVVEDETEDVISAEEEEEVVETGEEPEGGESVTATERQMSELRRQLAAEQKQSKKMSEQYDRASRMMAERIEALETAARHKRFTDLVMGQGGESDGLRWFGEIDENVEMLETLADTLPGGEGSEQFKRFMERQQALAEQVRTSGLFSEKGKDAVPDASQTPYEKLETVAKQRLEEGHAKNFAEGLNQAIDLHRDWYEEHSNRTAFGRGPNL